MPKTNQEEYEVLKELENVGFKWVSKNRAGWITSHYDKGRIKLSAGYNSDGSNLPKKPDDLFRFIDHNDTYNIAELIEEYENTIVITEFVDGKWRNRIKESEETEVKNIEWLKEEIENMPHTRMKREGMEDYILISKSGVLESIDQLDEPEVLSREFINEKAVEVYADTTDAEVHAVFRMRDLQNLLVPKQDEPETLSEPLGNAETFSNAMEQLADELNRLGDLERDIENLSGMTLDEIKEEARSGGIVPKQEKFESKIKTLIEKYEQEDGEHSNSENAWIDDFIYDLKSLIEKEQKYYVLDSEDIPLLEKANNQTCKTTTGLSIYEDGRDNSRFELTEQEIKDYDERFWPFAVKVEELEE